MSRHWKSILCCLCVSATWPCATGAEDLKPFDDVPNWGVVVDPVGDCKFSLNQKVLSITVPGEYHDLWPTGGKVNAPMVLQDVAGDFTVEVTVRDVTQAQPGTMIAGLNSKSVFHAGTLMIWQDSKSFARFDRSDMHKDGRAFNTCYWQAYKAGERKALESRLVKNQPTHLRLQRRTGSVVASYSEDDGKSWQSFPELSITFPDKIKVGVAALNNSTDVTKARFADFQLLAE